MITYTVSYKATNWMFYKTLKNVKYDGVLDAESRWFILADESRIELPRNYEFKFSKERFLKIKEDMSNAAGTTIVTNNNV